MAIEALIQKLKEAGCRDTPVRRTILNFLLQKEGPSSAIEIQEALCGQGLSPNKSTIYRQLETLVEKGIIEPITIEANIQHFELKQGHHHHFICTACKAVFDFIDSTLEKQFKSLNTKLKNRGLKASHHELNLYGLCKACS